jgi:hypothetical protein
MYETMSSMRPRLEGIWRAQKPRDGAPVNFRERFPLFGTVDSQIGWLPKRNLAMRQMKLIFAAAALFWSSVAIVRAESIMASNNGGDLPPAVSSSAVAAPSNSTVAPPVTAAPPVAAASPAAAVAARSEDKDPPQDGNAIAAPPADRPAVLAGRPAAHHIRTHHACAHRRAQLHRRAAQARTGVPRAPVWLAAPSVVPCGYCWQLVLLGVGY